MIYELAEFKHALKQFYSSTGRSIKFRPENDGQKSINKEYAKKKLVAEIQINQKRYLELALLVADDEI